MSDYIKGWLSGCAIGFGIGFLVVPHLIKWMA